MRLINVPVLLEFEISGNINPRAKVMEERNDTAIKYAILSHRWSNEVNYSEMVGLTTIEKKDSDDVRKRAGFQKIISSCQQAQVDGLEWLWVDTCCIDKRSSAELSEAINSMYRWYANSSKCYAYLHDVEDASFPMDRDNEKYHRFNGWSEWFSRGWTLQELIAPKDVRFFNKRWNPIGNKYSLASTLHKITRVPTRILEGGLSAERVSVAQIMSWAADRETTRVEDRAYSLIGLFGVHMPMLYGEGCNAFHRLQLEIIRMSNDQSIFAWGHSVTVGRSGSVLADDPNFFRDCNDVLKKDLDAFINDLKYDIPSDELLAFEDERHHTYSVTNAGIQMWLPITPYRWSGSVFKASLCCYSGAYRKVTILLVLIKSVYYRYFGVTGSSTTMPKFQQLRLGYRTELYYDDFTFKFDFRSIFCEDFSLQYIYPADIAFVNDSITLSRAEDRVLSQEVVIVYGNQQGGLRFAIGVGYYPGGYAWANIICDKLAVKGTVWSSPEEYAHKAFNDMQLMGTNHSITDIRFYNLVQHVHFPRSIQGVDVICKQSAKSNGCLLIIDLTKCMGDCATPRWKPTYVSS